MRTQIPVRPSASRFALALMLALGATAVAYRPASAEIEHPRPFLVRVEGFVGDKPEGVKSLDRWVVAIDGRPYTFHVMLLQPSVDVAFWNILNKLEPLPITLTLYGDPALLQRFIDTPPGQRIRMIGNFDAGPGPVTLQLTSIEPVEVTPGITPTQP